MVKGFIIYFDFPLEHSHRTVKVMARATLHHSHPFYVIDDFKFPAIAEQIDLSSIIPSLQIELLEQNGVLNWVHRDSKRTSALSNAIGLAIEKSGHFD